MNEINFYSIDKFSRLTVNFVGYGRFDLFVLNQLSPFASWNPRQLFRA